MGSEGSKESKKEKSSLDSSFSNVQKTKLREKFQEMAGNTQLVDLDSFQSSLVDLDLNVSLHLFQFLQNIQPDAKSEALSFHQLQEGLKGILQENFFDFYCSMMLGKKVFQKVSMEEVLQIIYGSILQLEWILPDKNTEAIESSENEGKSKEEHRFKTVQAIANNCFSKSSDSESRLISLDSFKTWKEEHLPGIDEMLCYILWKYFFEFEGWNPKYRFSLPSIVDEVRFRHFYFF